MPNAIEATLKNVTLFPLFSDTELLPDNPSPKRVLNITILVGPNQKMVIPVSCVERGRWHSRSAHFTSEERRADRDPRKLPPPGRPARPARYPGRNGPRDPSRGVRDTGETVIVHGRGGLGRSGTIAACCLAARDCEMVALPLLAKGSKMKLAVGNCVQHRKLPEWGLGIVFAVPAETKVDVFFESHPSNRVVRLKIDPAMLEIANVAPTEKLKAYLEAPPRAARRSSKPGKKAPRREVGTQQEALDRFLALFPGGFNDPTYLAEERNYKLEASALFAKLLSPEIRMECIREQRVDALVEAALQIDGSTALISPFEKAAFRDGLKDPQAALTFFGALSALIDSPAPSAGSFETLARAVEALPATKGRVFTWPIVTVFPFLASPGQYLFLKPESTRNEAARLQHDLKYESAPNWVTYASALSMAERLKAELAELGCRDMIDVQSFIYRT